MWDSFKLGVHIEGVGGVGSGTAADGTLWTTSGVVDYSGPWDVDERTAFEQPFDVLTRQIPQWGGDYETSEVDPEIALDTDDVHGPKLIPGDRTDYEAKVAADNNSTIEVEPTGALQSGHYHIGSEVVRFDSIASTSSTTETWNVTRARYLTPNITHFSGQWIHARIPNLANRPLRVVLIREGSSEVIWTGLVQSYTVQSRQDKLRLTAREALAFLDDLELNNETQAFQIDQPIEAKSNGLGYTGRVYVDESWENAGWWNPIDVGAGKTVDLQIGDQPAPRVLFDESQGRYFISPFGLLAFYDRLPPVDEDVEPGSTVYPILIYDRSSGFGPFERLVQGSTSTQPDVSDLKTSHWLTHALMYLLSTGTGTNNPTNHELDILSEAWGIGLPKSLVDVETFIRLIRKYPSDTLDQYIWGWNGETVDIWSQLKRWAKNFNYVFRPDSEGRLSVAKIRGIELTDGADLQDHSSYIIPEGATEDFQADETATEVRATYDELPMITESSTSVTLRGLESQSLTRSGEVEFDYKELDRGRSIIRSLVEDKLEKRAQHPPVLEARLTVEHADLANTTQGTLPSVAGRVGLLGGPEGGLVGPDGNRELPDDQKVKWAGIVVSRDTKLKSYTADATVLLYNFRQPVPTRQIAPAAEVNEDSSAGTTTGTDGDGNDWISYELDEFRSPDDDVGFVAGDDIVINRPNGRADIDRVVMEIQSVSSAEQRLYVDQLPATAPDVGDFVRLADEDEFSNATWSGSAYWDDPAIADRLYCYLVEPNQTFSSGEDPDIYAGV